MKMPFDPAELAMLINNGTFGVSDDKLEEIAETMHQQRLSLNDAAWACDIDPGNLTASDKAVIRDYYDEPDDDE